MDVRLNDDTMKDIIAKAVIDTLTPEKREELISAAIKALLTPSTSTGIYGNQPKSPLQDAFDTAVRSVANEVAREQIMANTELRAKIKDMIGEAWLKLVANESGIVEKLASALERGLTGDRY